MTTDADIRALAEYSAEIGSDPLLIQGAGGNTSIKFGTDMWIKASGTKLKDAATSDLFVNVDGAGIAEAVRTGSSKADQPQTFLREGTLRPSIETCLHAIMPHRIVIHVHCVSTIAGAIRKDARDHFDDRLAGMNWAFVPYSKPGAGLAAGVLAAAETPRDIYVLGNHGLLLGAETVDAARDLLTQVTAAVTVPATFEKPAASRPNQIDTRFGAFVAAPTVHPLHTAARSAYQAEQVGTCGLFPDQVLFCGPDIATVQAIGETDAVLTQAEARYGKPPVAFLLRDNAVYLHADSAETEQDMLTALGEVMARVPNNTELTFLTPKDCADLLNWDAEEYRHRMNAKAD